MTPFNAITVLKTALDDIMGVNDAVRGQPVPNAESGRAYEVLQQATLGPLTLMARQEAAFWSDSCSLVMSMHSVGVTRRRNWLATPTGAARSAPWGSTELPGDQARRGTVAFT